jgi:hypothetical protein
MLAWCRQFNVIVIICYLTDKLVVLPISDKMLTNTISLLSVSMSSSVFPFTILKQGKYYFSLTVT